MSAIALFNRNMAKETENLFLAPEVVRSGVSKLLKSPDLGFYLVAEQNNKVVGSLMITTEWSDWRCARFWWIQSVYVLPDFRRKGLYGRLYSEVKKLAQSDSNVCGFRLYVEKNNTIAKQAYRKYGMHKTAYRLFEEAKPNRNIAS